VSVDKAVGEEILRDGDEPLRTLLTSLSQLPGYVPPLLSVRSLYAGGEFVQCALDSHLPLSELSSLSLHPITPRSRQMLVRNRLWCVLYSLPRLRRVKVSRYELGAMDHSVLFSLPLEHLDLSTCTRAESTMGGLAAVGVSRTLRLLLLETEGVRMERQEAGAFMLNLSRIPHLAYFALNAVLLPSRLRLLSYIQQLTAVDLSYSAIDPAYLSFFVSPTNDPVLPRLIYFSAAQTKFALDQRRNRSQEGSLQRTMVRFTRAYSRLRTCRLALSGGQIHNIGMVAEALNEVREVRTFGLTVAHRDDTFQRGELQDSDDEDEEEDEEEKEERKEEPKGAPPTVSLSWLSILELDAVPLQDASLLAVLKGGGRLRRVTCRNCGQQTTAAWLLAAMNAPHLISLVLYAEQVKVTAAAWKRATEDYPSLAYLIDPPAAAASLSPTNHRGYPGLAQLEIRMVSAQQSDKAGFTQLMHLMAAAPITALNIHLPVNAVLGSRVGALTAMSHIQSLHIVPLPAGVQSDTADGAQHTETANKIQQLLSRCECDRQQSQQEHAEWLTAGWDRDLMRDGPEGSKGSSVVSQQAAVHVLKQGDDFTQGGGMFNRMFTTSAREGQMAGREQFFHELASLCDCEAEDD